MLKQFNSNTRQLNRIVKKYNLTNISASVYEGIEVSGSNDFKTIMGDYINQSYTISSSFDGRNINGNPYEVDINGKPILNSQSLAELSASIAYDKSASVWLSRELVASSKTNSLGFVNIARAIPSLWRCPPLRRTPLSPTIVSYPSGKPSIN